MKKKHIQLLALVSLMLGLTLSCDRHYLEPWPPDGAREPQDVWSYYDYTRGFLDKIYGDNLMPPHVNDVSGYAMLASATDEAKHSVEGADVYRFVNGAWSPSNGVRIYFSGNYYGAWRTPWDNAYMAIRRANIFLENVDNSILIDDISNPARRFDRTYFKAQAYFLRAYFQFDLLRRYGPFPITTHSLTPADDVYKPRNTMEECFRQIIEDCDKAIEGLPLLWDDKEFYRPNKTTAQALKSRATLYYASPLYQGDFEKLGIAKGETGDVERWKEAVRAARATINDNPYYDLITVTRYTPPYSYTGTYCQRVGQLRGASQIEVIWGSQYYQIYDEYYNMPTGLQGCYGFTNPTQDFVDMFEVVYNHGKPNARAEKFDWNNPDHAKDPYSNRDPRFYASITFNGLRWGFSSSRAFIIDTYEGGAHRDRLNPNSTKTGYYYRKRLSENFYANVSGMRGSYMMRLRPEYRVAEILLNYAEAMNEAYGPEATEQGGVPLRIQNISNALEAVNAVRARVKMPPIPSGLTKEQMREAIQHERAIELCFEGHRFYDLRRWKEGEKLGGPIHGIRIEATGFNSYNRPTGFNYTVEKVEDRVWHDKMYWWPIPYDEIVKYEGKLVQNPQW
ncbi:MAG: RagB/SusD family nutrient uptake outer membrane protein [Bacteroidales bacterium]|nr:RagB/SusD family nutrient uptake outer membrane protein [Bacteroidales bacterium]